MGKLTAIAVKTHLTTPGTYQDGDGLFLKVDKRGGASWLLRLQHDGKRRDIGIGSAKLVTLAIAREKARELRSAVKVDRRDVLAERKDAAAATVTFKDAAIQYHAENEGGWKSKTYARQWLAGLETYAFPRLGKETTGAITAADIIATLSPIWQTIPDTARQVRNRICVVLDYAHAKGWRSSEAPSGNGSLKAGRGLPRQQKEQEHREAMPYAQIPAFIKTLQRKPSFGRLGLEMIILTCSRRTYETQQGAYCPFKRHGAGGVETGGGLSACWNRFSVSGCQRWANERYDAVEMPKGFDPWRYGSRWQAIYGAWLSLLTYRLGSGPDRIFQRSGRQGKGAQDAGRNGSRLSPHNLSRDAGQSRAKGATHGRMGSILF
jgi:Arm DNA-binding domain